MVSIWYQTGPSASIWNHFLSSSSLSALYPSFSTPLPSFSSTFVLLFSRNVLLPSRYVSTIGLVVALGLHSSRIKRSNFPRKLLIHADPVRSDHEKNPNRNFSQAAFTHGAPRQPPLQDYAAYAHPSFPPHTRTLCIHTRPR